MSCKRLHFLDCFQQLLPGNCAAVFGHFGCNDRDHFTPARARLAITDASYDVGDDRGKGAPPPLVTEGCLLLKCSRNALCSLHRMLAFRNAARSSCGNHRYAVIISGCSANVILRVHGARCRYHSCTRSPVTCVNRRGRRCRRRQARP